MRLALIILVSVVLLAGCRQTSRSVLIGVDNSPPFYIFQPDGSVRGLAVDVLSEAARRSNIQVRWVPLSNTPLDKALESRAVQMWPAVGATSYRLAKFYLSEPWIESDYLLVSPQQNPVRNVGDAVGLRIAHARLSMTTRLAKRSFPHSERLVMPDRAEAVEQMCKGNAAAALVESRMLESMLLDRPPGCSSISFTIANVPGATTPLSIAAVPEVAALARELRFQISNMALDGQLGTILNTWAPFSAEVARSIGVERAEALRNRYLTVIACGLLACAVLLGFVAHRAFNHRRAALAAEEEMRTQATEDALTGLANRSLFTARLMRSMAQSHRERGRLFGVLFLDLDHFKVINDSLGHLAGDQLLVGIARRLSQAVRSSDLVGRFSESCTARLGGDEFAVLIENIQSSENARRIADRIQREMSLPFFLENRPVFTTFSIGVALSNGNYHSPEEILRDADTAMYAAKTSGKARFAIFDPTMRERAIARLEIETDLRRALTSQELVIHYQPEIDIRSGEIIGFEALVRWLHPKHGLVSPLDFIPIAEETGLIAPLGAWVLQEACSQIRRWQEDFPGYPNLRVSVNLSGKQLTSKTLLEDVEKALHISLLRPECLDLEVTESTLMEDTEATIQVLMNLKALGIGLQIDDFGTGYSSLSYLHRLPFDTLKIDRSFIHSMDKPEDGVEIVRTIMALAQSLKMTVVAEGVENPTQLVHLREMGCRFAQGNHFSEPLEPSSAERLLALTSARKGCREFMMAS